MAGLNNLRLCVEKSLSKKDSSLFKENFIYHLPGPLTENFRDNSDEFILSNKIPFNIEDKELEKIIRYPIETYENGEPSVISRRIAQYIDNDIIVLTEPELGVAQSIIQKKFIVKKITISFGSDKNAEWSKLSDIQNIRDDNGKIIEIDPIEYEIRKLSPINAVKKVLRERIFPIVNIGFDFLEEDTDIPFDILKKGIVRISFDKNGGSWSMVGMSHFFSQDEFTMNFGWLDSGTIMHEFGHMLGLIHEHQVGFGKSIEWNEPLVYSWAEVTYGWDRETTYDNIIKKYDKSQINGTDFDSRSIMLYFFPPQLTLDKKGSHQNLRLSIVDVGFIMSLFPSKDMDYKKIYRQIYGTEPEKNKKIFIPKLFRLMIFLVIFCIIVYIITKLYNKNKII